jgi:hypothetical protein
MWEMRKNAEFLWDNHLEICHQVESLEVMLRWKREGWQ